MKEGDHRIAAYVIGSVVPDEKTGELSIRDIGADAQINLARGSVITNAEAAPMPKEAAKRTAAFLRSAE